MKKILFCLSFFTAIGLSARSIGVYATGTSAPTLSDGSVTAEMKGGTAPYTYTWFNSSNTVIGTSATVTGLAAGSYTVSITDAAPFVYTETVVVTDPPPLVIDGISGVNTLTVVTGGGYPPYNLTVDGVTQTSPVFTGVSTGKYKPQIADERAATKLTTDSISVYCEGDLVVTGLYIDPTCNGNSNGTIFQKLSGGASPFTYLWGSGHTTRNRNLLAAGTYSVTITDNLGRTCVKSHQLNQPTAQTTPTCHVITEIPAVSYTIQITGASGGNPPYEYRIGSGGTWQSSNSFSGQSGGTKTLYYRTVSGQCQKSAIKSVPSGCTQ